MAGFAQGPWQANVQQHSLRCMSAQQNKEGADAYVEFKEGDGDYGRRRSKGKPGKWEKCRAHGLGVPLPTFTKFVVQPNFDAFEKTGDFDQDLRNENIRK